MIKTRGKIILDRWLARPAAFFLNLIVIPFGKIVHIDHDDSPEKVKVIAVTKLLGIGSILRATPLVKALKRKYPDVKYIMITTLKNKQLVESISLFDEYLYLNDSSIFKLLIDVTVLIVKLWKRKVDLYFDLEVYSAFSTILATLSLARNRYGFYRESTQFRLGLTTHLVYFNDHQNISRIYLQLARACGIKDADWDYKMEKLKIDEAGVKELKSWMEDAGLHGKEPYIVVNPNTSDLLLERRWPFEYFVLLINALAENWNNPIFLVGSSQENPYNAAIYNKLSLKAKNITNNCAGKISLKAVMALISETMLMITNDSGLYHMAVDFEVPTISLWGPGNPDHYRDLNNPVDFVFYPKDFYCSPCIYKADFPPCRGNNLCMYSISPKEVYLKACEILRNAPIADTSAMEMIYQQECSKDLDITVRVPKVK